MLKTKIFRILRAIYPLRCSFVAPSSSVINVTKIRHGRGCFVTVGEQCWIDAKILFDRPGASICIGSRVFIGPSALIAAEKITIGDDVLISWGVVIVDHDSHSTDYKYRRDDVVAWQNGRKDWAHVPIAPVHIGSKVWIGFGASILRGIHVGDGAVIAANSVVTKDVPPWTIVAVNPARVIKTLNPSTDP